MSRQHRRTLVARAVLVPVGRALFRHGAHPPSWRQAVLAAVLAAGPGAVASHLAAAALWKFDSVAPGVVEVTVPWPRLPRATPGRVHRSRDLQRADVDSVGPVPCTSPARTLLDIAPRLRANQLEAALDGAERDGLVWRPHMRWRLDQLRRRGRPGVARLERLLDTTDGRPLGDSYLEQEALRLVGRSALPVPRCQVRLRPGGGGPARVDLLWDDERLVAEVDGHGTHATRRQRQADAERSSRLGLDGWRVVRFTYEDVVERPGYVVDTLRQWLEAGAPLSEAGP